jgi:hypothetical protein
MTEGWAVDPHTGDDRNFLAPHRLVERGRARSPRGCEVSYFPLITGQLDRVIRRRSRGGEYDAVHALGAPKPVDIVLEQGSAVDVGQHIVLQPRRTCTGLDHREREVI